MVFLSIIPETIMAPTPIKYAEAETQPALLKSAPAIRPIIGSFAPHGINVVVIIVILRSRSFSIVREAITPGTPQPVPISIGIKDFPESPNLRNILSITNAILAIYPHASRKPRNINRTSIWGTNPSTAPTPAIIPSTISPCNHAAQFMLSSSLFAPFVIQSPKRVSLVQPVTQSPTVVTDT